MIKVPSKYQVPIYHTWVESSKYKLMTYLEISAAARLELANYATDSPMMYQLDHNTSTKY